MIIYLSGSGSTKDNPEVILGKKANLMLSFYSSSTTKKPESRFLRLYKARSGKKKRKGKPK